jgi:hypothetical protein
MPKLRRHSQRKKQEEGDSPVKPIDVDETEAEAEEEEFSKSLLKPVKMKFSDRLKLIS